MKLGQFKRSIFFQNNAENEIERIDPDLFLLFMR